MVPLRRLLRPELGDGEEVGPPAHTVHQRSLCHRIAMSPRVRTHSEYHCQPLRAFLEKGVGYYLESVEPASFWARTGRRHPWSTCVSPHSGAGSQPRGSEATLPGWGQAWLSLNACMFSAPSPKCSALSSEVLQREPEEKPNLREWDKPHSQDVPFQGPCPSCPKPLISTVLLGPQAPRSPGKPSSPVSPASPTMHLHAAGRTTSEPAMALPWAAAGTHPPSPTIILDTATPFQALLSPQLNHSFIHFFC